MTKKKTVGVSTKLEETLTTTTEEESISSSSNHSSHCLSPVNVAQHNRRNIYDDDNHHYNNKNDNSNDKRVNDNGLLNENCNDELFRAMNLGGKSNKTLSYYRVSYRGIIALLSKPDLSSPKSGVYVSYGEIIATSHPILRVRKSTPSTKTTTNQTQPNTNTNTNTSTSTSTANNHPHESSSIKDDDAEVMLCIRVDDVLTGGYALDGQINHHTNASSSNNSTRTSIEEDHYGYVFLHMARKIAKIPLLQSVSCLPPLLQSGHFFYKVCANTPLPFLAGPSLDAPPLTRSVLLPGTIHECCMRMGTVGLSQLQDGVVFLRLAYKRGWVADRRILLPQSHTNTDTNTKISSSKTILLMKEVTDRIEFNNNNNISGVMIQDDTSVGASTISSASSSISSYATIAHKRNKIRRQRRKRIPMDITGKTKHQHHRHHTSYHKSSTPKKTIQEINNDPNTIHTTANNMSSPSISDVTMMTDDAITKSLPIMMEHSKKNYNNHNNTSSSTHSSSTTNTATTRSNTTAISHSSSNYTSSLSSNHSNNSNPNNSDTHTPQPTTPNYFLMRVLAPKGLKILDAPHFQVNHLIRGQHQQPQLSQNTTFKNQDTQNSSIHRSMMNRNSTNVTPTSMNNKNSTSIFHTMAGSLQNHSNTHHHYNHSSNTLNNQNVSSNHQHHHHHLGNNCKTCWEFDSTGKTRILPRGTLFEASKRMETASVYTSGAGLIKLADNTGWAIIPKQEDLEAQYYNTNYRVNLASKTKTTILPAYEEVGVAYVTKNINKYRNHDKETKISIPCRWLRITQQNGVIVSCAPSLVSHNDEDLNPANSFLSSSITQSSSTLSATSTLSTSASNLEGVSSNNYELYDSTSSNTDVTTNRSHNSRFSSKFLSPRKQQHLQQDDRINNHNPKFHAIQRSSLQRHFNPILPCGLCVEVEDWDPENQNSNNHKDSMQSFVRLRDGQGWIPRMIHDEIYAVEVKAPKIHYGSFWFRVKSEEGIRVRQGPSRLANSIKADHDKYLSFECGEFLRASEILEVSSHLLDDDFDSKSEISSSGKSRDERYSVCFAKLFRNNHHRSRRHGRHNEDMSEISFPLSIHDLSNPGEWVQVSGSEGEKFLESCHDPPAIKRHPDGWRYSVVSDSGLKIYKGPSFHSGPTTIIHKKNGMFLKFGDKILVNELVRAFGDDISWLRLKNGRGWVHNYDNDGKPVVVEMTSDSSSIRQKPKENNKGSILETSSRFSSVLDSQYNGIIARLFQSDSKA